MAKILIDPANATPCVTRMEEVARNLKELSGTLDDVQGKLGYKIAGQEQITDRLRNVSEQITREEAAVRSMRDGLEQIIYQYQRTESVNLGQIAAEAAQFGNQNPGFHGMPSIMDDLQKLLDIIKDSRNTPVIMDHDPSYPSFDLSQLMDGISDWIDFGNFWGNYLQKQDSNDAVGFLGTLFSFFGAVSSFTQMKGTDSLSSKFANTLGFLNGGVKMDRDTLKLIDLYGSDTNKGTIEGLNFISDGFGILKGFFKNYSDSDGINTKFFRNINEVTSAIKKLGIDIYNSNHIFLEKGFDKVKAEYARDVNVASPILALVNMATYSVADGIEKFQDGTDMGEIGEWLKGTGVTGANTMISCVTGGLVNLDTDKVLTIYKETEDYALNVINSLNLPPAAKKALCVPASVPVALWATGKSLVNFGEDIGNSILGIIDKLKN